MVREFLLEAPHRIYNVDETGFNSEHTPIYVVGPNKLKFGIPAIVSPRSATTTMISAVSASGQVVPPYLVFKGKRDVSICHCSVTMVYYFIPFISVYFRFNQAMMLFYCGLIFSK